jgi:3-oxoadipate enol-lactonase
MLLIQGYAMPGKLFEATGMVSLFADDHQVAIYDNPGTGLSDVPDRPRTIPEFAADAQAVMDALGWDKARIFGASMGTMIALQLALDAPERVRCLVMIGTYCGWPHMRETQDPGWLAGLEGIEKGAALQADDPAAAARLFIEAALDDSTSEFHDAWREQVEAVIRELPTRLPPIVLGEGEGIADWCVLDRLGEIAAPTLMFHGANDRLLPAEGVFEATRRMQRAELHMYNPGDHRAVNPHNIARVLPYIKSWLAGLP